MTTPNELKALMDRIAVLGAKNNELEDAQDSRT